MAWEIYCHSKRKEWAVFDERMRLITPVYRFLLSRKNSGYSQNTLKANGTDLMHWYRFLSWSGTNMTKAESKHIEDFREWMMLPKEQREKPRSTLSFVLEKKGATEGSTWNRILSTIEAYVSWSLLNDIKLSKTLSSISQYKVRKGHARQNKIRGSKSLWTINVMKKSPEYIPPHHRNKIRGHLNSRDELIFDFIYFSGMRIGETLSFKASQFPPRPSPEKILNIQLEESTEERLDVQTKTGGRTLYIPNALYQRLSQYRLFKRGKSSSDRMFVTTRNSGKSAKGSPLAPDSFRKNLALACKKSGLSYVPHDLRHTLATDILRITNDMVLAQDILGHKSLDSTRIYVHPLDEDIVNDLSGVYSELYAGLIEGVD